MDLQIGSKLHNFIITNIRPIPGKDASLVEMEYEKTKTPLCWVKSCESNKLFSIAFKTIPENDTGVFHILEHSVLCGSKKYPVKEPFVELLKSSMNTFLNAMTFPDKTLYPISSRNEQDFLNLTSVYLDAVFAPNILTNPNIFYQEGWHYETEDENLIYNGVVFNEMKGAFSSVDQVAYQNLQRLLFPDNGYGFVSGGDPTAIPNLTYDDFINTYKRNYHPTNAKIFLDGDIPLEKVLVLLDSYLSKFEMGIKQELSMQEPVSREMTVYYEAANDGTPKANLVIGKILCDFSDKTKLLAFQILCDILVGSNEAPLKRALLEAGLCQEVSANIVDGQLQPYLMLRLHNMKNSNSENALSSIKNVVEKLVKEGIDKKQLTASLNSFAFKLREMQEPQGLYRCMNTLSTWLYDGDPIDMLHYDETFDALRTMINTNAYELLLKEMLYDETGLCILHVLPSETYGIEVREKEAIQLQHKKETFTIEQLESIKKQSNELSAWQQEPDSTEQLATLPVLELKEISKEPTLCKTTKKILGPVTILRHQASSNGIVHLSAYFNISDISLDNLTKLSLLSEILCNLPTREKDVLTLQNEIKTYIGQLRFNVEVFANHKQRTTCTPVIFVQCSVLKENLPHAESLIYEILTSTDFQQVEHIREIVLQTDLMQQQMAIMNGHSLAMMATQAHFSSSDAVANAINGISFVQWVHKFAKDFDTDINNCISLWQNTLKTAICQNRMTVSITEEGTTDINSFVKQFPLGEEAPEKSSYTTSLPKRLGIRIPAQVNYASVGYHIEESQLSYRGTARLLSNILSLDYLWNTIRVQGGAYGAGMRIQRNGSLFTYSYRDPSPENSLKIYGTLADFVSKYVQNDSDITKYIISTIAETEPLVGAAQQGMIADRNWFSKFDYSCSLREREELLSTNTSELLHWCDMLQSIATEAAVCVVGFTDALENCSDYNLCIFDIEG